MFVFLSVLELRNYGITENHAPVLATSAKSKAARPDRTYAYVELLAKTM